MPEIKNTFLKSKMNKDLDARLVPNGEYRDAQNISISRSEGSDVGALENVLGNTKLTSFKTNLGYLEDSKNTAKYFASDGDVVLNGLEVIGFHMDVANDRIFLFLTDYSDASNDNLSNFAPGDITTSVPNPPSPPNITFNAKGAACYIVQYNVSNNSYRVLLGGKFLNFSKTHPIININIIENMLFWTDNRNQPRKINIDFANNNSYELSGADDPYYYNEDHISVAKFAPFESISFLDTSNKSGLINVSTEFFPAHIINTLGSVHIAGSNVFNLNFEGTSYSITGNNPDLKIGDQIFFPVQLGLENSIGGPAPIEEELTYEITNVSASNPFITIVGTDSPQIVQDAVFQIRRKNPDYDENYKGDENLLKEEFVRFSYRFKYDDGEYSLIAPFTQAAFIPEQFGHFIGDDENVVLQSGNVKFMENDVSKVKLNIKLPENANSINDKLKIKEIQILTKNSDDIAVRVVEDVPVSKLSSNSTVNYVYEYLSSKPIKTLPEADLIRVSDKAPIRALTQEVVGNRLVYGNFIDKHATPDYLQYDLKYKEKTNNNFTKEFPNHTVKQNRSYQVGVVLYDRYGRSSNVILSDAESITSEFFNSTIYAPYTNFGANSVNYWGNFLEFTLKNPIPHSDKIGYPGLYSSTNPNGYYSYRIVIKQQEQEYYNVYTPGALAGELIWDTKVENKSNLTVADVTANIADYLPSFHSENRITLLNLFGDNINKIPRELKEVNGNDTTFDSRVLLYNRVNPVVINPSVGNITIKNTQSVVSEKGEKVVSIEPFRELGSWANTKGNIYPYQSVETQHSIPQPFYPYFASEDSNNDYSYNFHDIFFNSSANPFIAKIETDFKIGGTPAYSNSVIDATSSSDMAGAKRQIERSWKNLGVFETKPTESVLDIYYETSTSGLISDLNSAFEAGAPYSLRDENGNDSVTGSLQFILSENDALGSPATLWLECFDINGNSAPATAMSMDIVIDGSSPFNDRTLDFTIEQDVAPNSNRFRIKSNALFMYGENANTLESYTFQILVTAGGISNILTLNNCRLVNQPPPIFNMFIDGSSTNYDLTTLPILPNQTELYSSVIPTGQLSNLIGFEVVRFTTRNGSADPDRRKDQIICKVLDSNGDAHPYLYVDNIRGNGSSLNPNLFVVHPRSNAIRKELTTQGQQLTTLFNVVVYDSNGNGGPSGFTEFSRTITFEK